MNDLRTARPVWEAGLIIVCRECDGYSKKLKRGLKDALDEAGLRKCVRIVESECLDICPKRATTVVTASAEGLQVTLVPRSSHGADKLAPLLSPLNLARSKNSGTPEPSAKG